MGKQEEGAIEVYARIKPTKKAMVPYLIHPLDHKLELNVPKNMTEGGYIDNSREKYEFAFSDILPTDAKQDEVFERVGRKAVLNVLDGYNATIFAYGQTGSGKTFSMTGGPEKYSDRGLIPRSLQLLFNEFKKRTDHVFSAYISYLEIYNEQAYDLLHPDNDIVKSVHDLPKVTLMENAQGEFVLQNLSTRMATSEEEGLNILFLGDTNRAVAETPMNLESSRSHCLFTVNVTAQAPGSELRRRSKLHLVDLAGSERVWKSNAEGSILTEAKFINKSLHYLERVILCLHEAATHPGRQVHIPYRDSLMTSLLRDSLGGNCKTTMIATMSVEKDQISETISTCRFAQRVGMIKNTAFMNEETDPQLVIRRLKKEIYELKQEIALLKGGSDRGPLAESEIERCQRQVRDYVEDTSNEIVLPLEDMQKIRQCFIVFKDLVLDMRGKGASVPAARAPAPSSKKNSAAQQQQQQPIPDNPKSPEPGRPPTPTKPGVAAPVLSSSAGSSEVLLATAQEQVRKLQTQLHQRDIEINILLNMIRKKNGEDGASTVDIRRAVSEQAASAEKRTEPPSLFSGTERVPNRSMESTTSTRMSGGGQPTKPNSPQSELLVSSISSAPGVIMDRQQAYEEFRKTYTKGDAMEENKNELKRKYAEAKSYAAVVNESKDRINQLKGLIEQKRKERAVRAVTDPRAADQVDPEEEAYKKQIEETKLRYQESFNRLRDAKSDIESLQAMLERSRAKMQSDFEQYYAILLRQNEKQSGGTSQQPPPQMQPQMQSSQDSGLTRSHERFTSPNPSQTNPVREAWGGSSGSSVVPPSLMSSVAPKIVPNSGGLSYALPTQSTAPPASQPQQSLRHASPYSSAANPVQTSGNAWSSPAAPPPNRPVSSLVSEASKRGGPMLTGNSEADKEILAFYQAREKLLRQSRGASGDSG